MRLAAIIAQVANDETSGPSRRYRLPLPSSVASIDGALSACGVSLTSTFDAIPRLPPSVTWLRRPAVSYPEQALRSASSVKSGKVELACGVTSDGHLQDCQVVSEKPIILGFGEEALRAAREARIIVPETVDTRGRILTFVVNSSLE